MVLRIFVIEIICLEMESHLNHSQLMNISLRLFFEALNWPVTLVPFLLLMGMLP